MSCAARDVDLRTPQRRWWSWAIAALCARSMPSLRASCSSSKGASPRPASESSFRTRAIARELRDLLALMNQDVPRGREALARLMPEPFRMFPEADGYRIEGGLPRALAGPEPNAAVLIGLSRRDRD